MVQSDGYLLIAKDRRERKTRSDLSRSIRSLTSISRSREIIVCVIFSLADNCAGGTRRRGRTTRLVAVVLSHHRRSSSWMRFFSFVCTSSNNTYAVSRQASKQRFFFRSFVLFPAQILPFGRVRISSRTKEEKTTKRKRKITNATQQIFDGGHVYKAVLTRCCPHFPSKEWRRIRGLLSRSM